MKEEQTSGATPPERNKIFGVKGATRASVNLKPEASDPNTYKSRGYEDKYEDDQLGDELGDEARIWRVMLDEGRAYDAAMLPRFRDHLDVDLVFAGLFSAIVTTFVAQTSQPSETNDSVMSVALLSELVAIQRAWAANIPVESVPAINTVTVPVADPWINRFWFLSLVFSLFAAFGAVIVRQWLQEYESDISGPPKRRALVRHYRHVGLLKWKVHLIVPILPMLLHVSLLLFFLGLILYVGQSDPTMSHGIIALTALIYLLYIVTTILPVFYSQCPYRSPLSTAGYWIKSLLVWLYRLLHHQSLSDALKTPGDHEWGAVSNIEDNLIPDSLDWATQASSDLSVAPLVVQAVSALRNDPGADTWADLPYAQLLRDRVIPWFFNTLNARRTVLNWAPGRENKLQRMACALLLVPLHGKGSSDLVCSEGVDMDQYRTCTSLVLQALTAAIISANPAEGTVALLSATILALGGRLSDLDPDSEILKDGALFQTIKVAYSSLASRSPPTGLRLRPIIWFHMLDYLTKSRVTVRACPRFAVAMWLSLDLGSSSPTNHGKLGHSLDTSSRMSLAEWSSSSSGRSIESPETEIYRLLCPVSCNSYQPLDNSALNNGTRLHMACHAIDFIVEENDDIGHAYDHGLGFLAAQFAESLVVSLGYGSIQSGLKMIGNSIISSLYGTSFGICTACGTPLAVLVKPGGVLPAKLVGPLFWLLVDALQAVPYEPSSVDPRTGNDLPEEKARMEISRALVHHVDNFHDRTTDILSDGDRSLEGLRNAVMAISACPELAVLLPFVIPVAIRLASCLRNWVADSSGQARTAADHGLSEAERGKQPPNDLLWLVEFDVVCAVLTRTHLDKDFSDASNALHQVLLTLGAEYRHAWRAGILHLFETYPPLTFAMALNEDTQPGWKVLEELIGDLESLKKQLSPVPRMAGMRFPVPREGRDEWYRLFFSRDWGRLDHPMIGKLVTLEEYRKRRNEANARADATKLAAKSNTRDTGTSRGEDHIQGVVGRSDSVEEELSGAQPNSHSAGSRHWKWIRRNIPFAKAVTRYRAQDVELA